MRVPRLEQEAVHAIGYQFGSTSTPGSYYWTAALEGFESNSPECFVLGNCSPLSGRGGALNEQGVCQTANVE